MSFQVINYLNMKRYRSGHNGADSKSPSAFRKPDFRKAFNRAGFGHFLVTSTT